jgi:hypothetical protein
MAEFKLGRIRFVWKGDWAADLVYYKDDVIAFGGKTYICVEGHTSTTDFFTDLDSIPTKWNLVSDGQTWKGDWRNDTDYVYNDLVKYGSKLYLCDTIHTSATQTGSTETYVVTVQNDPSVSNGVFYVDGVATPDLQMIRGVKYIWDQDHASNLFAGAGNPRHPMIMSTTQDGTHGGGDIWTEGVQYFLDGVEVADAAAYDAGFEAATTRAMHFTVPESAPDKMYYFCFQHANMSSTAEVEVISLGLETDADKWQTFADGMDWKGEWHEDFNYRLNDFVKYGGSTFVCIDPHTSTSLGSGLGLENDLSKWESFNSSLRYRQEWVASEKYLINDVVKYGASLWIATEYHTSSADFPTDTAKWEKLVDGFQFESDWSWENYYQPGDIVQYGGNQYIAQTDNNNSIPPSNPLDWELFSEGFKFIGDWGEDSSAYEYKVGDVVRHGGYTYRCILDHQDEIPPNETYWQRLNYGFEWRGEWRDDAQYYEGDVVRYGDNSYVCILSHISEGDDYSSLSSGAEGSRPDLADSGQYWSALAIGSEQSVLTTTGDMVYYSGSAPTRLPIGRDGQVLTVNADSLPEWAFIGSVDDVYYVAEHGRNNPAPLYGKSIDRPWASIRYAAQQIEKGAKNPEAAKLLELNRRFIQREIVEWTQYQIANNIAPFTTAFDYQTVKCERDMGYIVDALIWDITHGGNVRSREAALSYVNETVGSEYLNQKTETVASINYGLSLIADVLNQEDPDVNYQVTNGDNSTAIVAQYTDIALRAENVISEITGLVGIVTDAITAGVADDIPERLERTTLIRVATGKYYETLPIRVPALCCVLGDELRAVTVEPRKASNSTLTPKTDMPFSYKAVERIASIASDIVSGTTITATTGNTQLQDQTWPYAETTHPGVETERLFRNIKDRIAIGLGKKENAILPVPHEMTDPNYGYLRELNELNKEFIQEEVIGYISDQFPDLKYSRTKCKQDVGFLIDAVAYDLTYGGNWQTYNAVRSYYDSTTANVNKTNDLLSNGDFATTEDWTITSSAFTITGGQLETAGSTAGTVWQKVYTELGQEYTVELTATHTADGVSVYAKNALADENPIDTATAITASGTITYTFTAEELETYIVIETDTSGDVVIDDVVLPSPQKAATIASYGYLRDLLQTVGRNITVTPVYQTDVAQIEGKAGSNAASNAVASLFNNTVLPVVENGADAATLTYPDTSGVDSALVTASTALNNAKATIQENTIDFINENFGSFKYNSAKCRRDLTNIITDVAYDVALGTNYNGIFQGLAYQRPNNAYNLQNQRIETVGAIRNARNQIRAILSDSGALTNLNTSFNEIVNVINNGTLGEAMPGDGTVADITWNDALAADQNKIDAKDNLQANIEFMKDDVIAYITQNYPALTYDSDKCARDVEYIVNALSYDVLFGGNMASTRIAESYFVNGEIQVANQETETIAAYNHLASIAGDIAREVDVTAQTGNSTLQTKLGSPASSTESTEISNNMATIIGVLSAGNLNSLASPTYPSITGASAAVQADKATIDSNRNDVILNTIQFITSTYNDFDYNHAKCSRDLGYIIDAARYDWMLGTNFASINAGLSYLRRTSNKVVGDQKTATIAANEYARTIAVDNVNSNATAIAGVNSSWELVQDTIWAGGAEGGNRQVDDVEVYNAIRMLELNKEFLVEEGQAYVDDYFSDTVTATSIDLGAGSGGEDLYKLTIADTGWMHLGMKVAFENPNGILSNTNFFLDNDFYVVEIYDSTTFSVSNTRTGIQVQTDGTSNPFTVKAAYEYDQAACARDLREYIDAVKLDLMWPQEWQRTYTKTDSGVQTTVSVCRPGVYRTRNAAQYYVNSVIGSQEENFYLMRNGTGLRMQTLDGLQGDLTAPNIYGSSRVTAGAYSSLDPGWGPDDQSVWITSRSPYMQNCTCFGYAAVGQKIDGALHNGGNDSMVSNDFTQLISDGIGAWITNNGRAELVSVFTYYSHVGYLAENGGRIRGTNGNNSYGTFGSVAEGVDNTETPVTAIVDNRTQYNATVDLVNTDADQILNVEFGHCGNEYTEAEVEIFGPGTGEVVVTDEFRDNSVFEARIIASEVEGVEPGGEGYTLASNVAQTGTTSSITIAQTDGNLSTAYPGMKVLIVGGAGRGQYAIIDTYNAGSKQATVVKESDGTAGWDHMVPGTTIVAPNATSTYEIEPAVSFTAPTNAVTSHSITSGTYSDIEYFETSAQYTNVASITESDGNGATFDITRNGEKYYVTLNNTGGGYTRLDTVTVTGDLVGGATPLNDIVVTITTIDANDGSIVDFDFTGKGQKGIFIAIPGTAGSTAAQTSIDGQTWSSLTLPDPGGSNTYSRVVSGLIDDGSSTFKQSFAVAVPQGGSNAAYTTDGVTWSQSTLPGTFATAGITGIAFGQITSNVGRFVAFSANDTEIVYSDNGGQTWSTTAGVLTGTNYSAITFGAKLFVAVRNGTNETMWSEDGLTWTGGSGLPNANWVDVTFGHGRFIAIASDGTAAYSLDGKAWTQNDLPDQGTRTYRSIAYGHGVFVATRDDANVVYSEYGLNWTTEVITTGANTIAFGNPDRTSKFVTIDDGATTVVNDCRIGCRARGRVSVANEQVFAIRLLEPGSGYDPLNPPTITVTDPNNIEDVNLEVRIGDGAIANPTFANRGSGYSTATGDINENASNGFADFYQDGNFVAVRRLSARPVNGSNVELAHLPGRVFKLVNTVSFRGTNDGSFSGFLQLSPILEINEAPTDGEDVEMRIRFSQVRLTGHDFLDIGTGNFADTNYPYEIYGEPVNTPKQANETVDANGGRVFFTATDQDGNFRVGDLFQVEQATGVATLDAEAFNIAGLQELSLGTVTLGGNSASITEFSTDPFFTANSDTVVPTQRAVKAYIEAQIGGGGASLNVNSVTAGDVFINTNQITTVSGEILNINATVNFTGTVLGLPLAHNYMLR